MVIVLNKLRQPMTLNLQDGSSLHLMSKGTGELTVENFDSVEVKNSVNQGTLLVIKMD